MNPLFDPFTIKTLKLPNRIVRSATWMGLADPDGAVTTPLRRVYETLAEGNIGLIISGFAFVSREGQGPEGQLGIHDESLIEGLAALVEGVHSRGGRIAAQIAHCGLRSLPEFNGGLEVLGPSEVRNEAGLRTARALSTREIARIKDDFGRAAARAKRAGFDAVQLHFAHGYLGSQFLSPRTNRRTDDYGGSAENRRRFPLEVLNEVREAVGPDFPVLAKLNLEDFMPRGLILDEGIAAAQALAEAGLDAIEVSGGTGDSGTLGPARNVKKSEDEAYFRTHALRVRRSVDIPVILVGGLRSPTRIAPILEEDGIDLISLSRPFIREPALVKRWSEGDLRDATCVSCSGCFLSVKRGRGVFCIRERRSDQKRM